MSSIYLSEKERYVISHLESAKFSLREIARRLGRHHTSRGFSEQGLSGHGDPKGGTKGESSNWKVSPVTSPLTRCVLVCIVSL